MSPALRRSPRGEAWTAVAVLFVLLLSVPLAARSQEGCAAPGQPVEMSMLLEKTIFQVDVLTLTVRVHGGAANRLRELRESDGSRRAIQDSVARAGASATCGTARLRFARDVSLDRFLEEARASSRQAMRAGYIPPETFDLIDRSLPDWYAFLEGRGVREGDRMTYTIRGDTLGIRYRSADGTVLLDRTDVGSDRRRSVLAGYFAEGSDFREGLIRSLFDHDGRSAPGTPP